MKKLLGLVTLLVVLFYAIGFMLPKEYEVERSREIAADREAVFATLVDLATWPAWSYWSEAADPECAWTFAGEDARGRPTAVHWNGPVNGERSLELVESHAHDRVRLVLTFVDGETRLRSDCALRLEELDGGTRVVWTLSGEMAGGAVHRWVGLLMDDAVGGALETSLDGLAAHLDPSS